MQEKKDLKLGGIYAVDCPRFNVGIWTGTEFKGPSIVDDQLVFVLCAHFSDGLPFGLATPTQKIGQADIKYPYDGYNLLVAMAALDEFIFETKQSGDIS